MTYWYVFSFDTKFSDGNAPPSSDIDVKNCQNSRSLSASGNVRRCCAAADCDKTATHRPATRAKRVARRASGFTTKPRMTVAPMVTLAEEGASLSLHA